jgi:Domain of unknown function (DUF1707)/Cell wall-active antibiotics response 4TMS YvqF
MDGQPGTDVSRSDQIRVSDAEREAIVARLNDATGEGRLTLEEFSDRVSAALAARTRGDLDRVVVDLPSTAVARSAPVAPANAPVFAAAQITPIGAVKRSGRWRLDRDTQLGTIIGPVKLDMRDAEIAASDLTLHVQAIIGSVKIWVPRGVEVIVDGTSYVGSRSVEDGVARPGAPVLRLRVDTILGSVKVYRV